MKRLLHMLACIAIAYCTVVAALAVLYIFVPPVSTLMLARRVTLGEVDYRPVPLSRISPYLVRMTIRAEDSNFCHHWGVDWHSMGQTIEDAATDDGPIHGASTIPMQVTKNLFLWPQQSYIRKAIEIPLAMALNALWSKSRMMEVYLSIAEWGNGIFGAEAAAQAYFHKPARELNQAESALLVAALPSPKRRNPARPSEYHARRAINLLKWSGEDVDTSCLHLGGV